jgi:hypothetical protein
MEGLDRCDRRCVKQSPNKPLERMRKDVFDHLGNQLGKHAMSLSERRPE